jgi:protein-tyrosine phosphatase
MRIRRIVIFGFHSTQMQILFVCLGNICRSPLAEALFVHKVTALDHGNRFRVDSCGTSDYNLGDSPDQRTVRNALKNGVSMMHTARQMSPHDFVAFDRILVMDRSNLRHALSVSHPKHHAKIALMRSFDPLGEGDVPDPYYGSEADFQEVFEILDRSVEALVKHLVGSSTH